MPRTNPTSPSIAKDDDHVFRLLAEARQQYDRYLEVINKTPSIAVLEAPAVPPSPDLPLSLTIRPNR